jgi:transcriptional regulator with XRE-family HTH domain
LGFSQLQLANETGIPIRTIQQYEQGQKNINKAQAEYIIKLAKALYCEPSELLELI